MILNPPKACGQWLNLWQLSLTLISQSSYNCHRPTRQLPLVSSISIPVNYSFSCPPSTYSRHWTMPRRWSLTPTAKVAVEEQFATISLSGTWFLSSSVIVHALETHTSSQSLRAMVEPVTVVTHTHITMHHAFVIVLLVNYLSCHQSAYPSINYSFSVVNRHIILDIENNTKNFVRLVQACQWTSEKITQLMIM